MFRALLTHRFWVMWVAAAAVLFWFWRTDPDGGAQLAVQLQSLLWVVVAAGPVYVLRRALMDRVRSLEAARRAFDDPIGAGLVFLGLCLLTGMLFLATSARAALPAGAVQYLPTLQAEISAHWSSLTMPSVLAAQVEQESGWRVTATLKTSREEGAGLGQFTRAYRADGSLRFDALAETRLLDPSLAGWTWANRFDPVYQLRGLVLKNRHTYNHIHRLVEEDSNALAMMDAAYNCGEGCVYARRRLCAQIAGCDPDTWFGHVEMHSTQSKAKWHGYGQSAHEITNTHVRNVMLVRRPKYTQLMGA